MILPSVLSASEHFQVEEFVNFWRLVCLGTCSQSSSEGLVWFFLDLIV